MNERLCLRFENPDDCRGLASTPPGEAPQDEAAGRREGWGEPGALPPSEGGSDLGWPEPVFLKEAGK